MLPVDLIVVSNQKTIIVLSKNDSLTGGTLTRTKIYMNEKVAESKSYLENLLVAILFPVKLE